MHFAAPIRFLVIAFALLLSAASSCFSQTLETIDQQLERAADSPDNIVRFVQTHAFFGWSPLWKALHIDDLQWLQWLQCNPLEALQTCSAEIIGIPNSDDVILLLEDAQIRHSAGLFRFRRSGSRWSVVAHFEPNLGFVPFRHKLFFIAGKPFLSISEDGAPGSGPAVFVEQESWIDLSGPELKPMFSFVTSGRHFGSPFWIDRRYTGHLNSVDGYPIRSIEVSYTVGFSSDEENGGNIRLGERYDVVRYVRRPGGEFTIDQTRSMMSEKDFELLFGDFDADLSCENFLKIAWESLKQTASSDSKTASAVKRKLRQIVQKCKDAPAKARLTELLEGAAKK